MRADTKVQFPRKMAEDAVGVKVVSPLPDARCSPDLALDKSVLSSHPRLLICSPGVPHSSRGASTVLFFHYIARLKREGFRTLNVLLLQQGNDTRQALAEYVALMAEPDRFEVLPCLAETFTRSSRWDISLDTGALADALRKVEAFGPDLIVALDLLSAWVVRSVDARGKLAWLGDLNFQTERYHAWYAARENPLKTPRLLLAWNRARIWKRVYREVLSGMNATIVASASSVKELRKLGIHSVYQPYPWPNPGGLSPGCSTVDPPPKPSFLFYGNLTGLGSRSAFHFLLHKICPRLLRLWGRNGFRVFIAGAGNLPEWVRRELAATPELTYRGFVEDIESLMASCHAVLVPIDVPVGNRSRLVNAMAKEILVIAHAATALANPDLVDGETCYLARRAGEFVERMRLAVEDPARARAIAARARRCYERQFRPERATERLVDELWRLHKDSARATKGGEASK